MFNVDVVQKQFEVGQWRMNHKFSRKPFLENFIIPTSPTKICRMILPRDYLFRFMSWPRDSRLTSDAGSKANLLSRPFSTLSDHHILQRQQVPLGWQRPWTSKEQLRVLKLTKIKREESSNVETRTDRSSYPLCF